MTAFKALTSSKEMWHRKKAVEPHSRKILLLESESALTMSAPSAFHLHSDTNKKLECLSQRASHQRDTEEGNRASSSLGKNQAELGAGGSSASLGMNADVPLFPASPCQHTKTGFSPRIFQLLLISVNINVWTIGLAPVSPLLCPENDL